MLTQCDSGGFAATVQGIEAGPMCVSKDSCKVQTLLSSGKGLLKGTYSVPTQETIPSPLGLVPAAGVSVSSLSFSTACKQLKIRDAVWADPSSISTRGQQACARA